MKTSIDMQIRILELIQSKTKQTGTVAYGLPNPTDHDRFCTKQVLHDLRLLLRAGNVIEQEAEGYENVQRSIKFQLGTEMFNVFCIPDEDIPILEAVTEMVTVACKYFPQQMQSKPFRVFIYRCLRDCLTMMRRIMPDVAAPAPENNASPDLGKERG